MKPQILVPLDGSLFSEQALPYACEIARRMDGTLELVMVHRIPIAWASEYDVTLEEVDEQIRASELSYLTHIAERMRQQQCLDVTTALLAGPAAPAVKNHARLNAPELIVMTTHGRGGVSRAWLGSVADELVRSINIPTLLVRPQRNEAVAANYPFSLDHILIPLDGSELSEGIIERALDLGSLTGARYTLMQVVTPVVSYPMLDSVLMAEPAAANEQQLRANAEAYLAGIAQSLRARGFTVDTSVVLQTQCAPGILEQALADDVDLIAMATHGRTGLKRLALGSVADKVLRGTFVPLLLLRPPAGNVGLISATANEHTRAVHFDIKGDALVTGFSGAMRVGLRREVR
jgi:nucleotide-binding universal stress UspA family protein